MAETETGGLRTHRGLQRRAVALAFVAMFVSAPGQSFIVAVFVDEMLAGTGLSRTAFSVLYALATVTSAFTIVFVGRAADRFGLRAAWLAVTVGLAAACAVAGLATGALVAFLGLALLRIFGAGSLPLVATLLAARWFHGRRGQAMAVASFGITGAATLLPPLVVALVVAAGWRAAYLLLGAAVLVLVAPLALLVREPSARGRVGGGEPVAADEAFPRALRRVRRLPRLELPTQRSRRLLLVLAAPPLVSTAMVFHAVSLLAARGLTLQQAGLVLTVFGLGSVAGTVAMGAVADRVTTRLLLSVMSGLFAVAVFALLLPGSAVAFAAFALLGAAGGVFGIASGIVWARTYGLAQLGRLQGTSFAVQIAGGAVGPLPLALSLALTGSYVPGLVGLGAYATLALAGSLRWRDPSRLRRARAARRFDAPVR
ncbi:MAG TPA: MFS transporter [Gaiellaceae bacterium]|nr:MFS transporter [Gaiellaceae bacterium]